MYNIVIRYFRLWSIQSYYSIVTLAIFLVLYITSLWLIYFITEINNILSCTPSPLHLFCSYPYSPLATTNLFSVSVNLFCFAIFALYVFTSAMWSDGLLIGNDYRHSVKDWKISKHQIRSWIWDMLIVVHASWPSTPTNAMTVLRPSIKGQKWTRAQFLKSAPSPK